MLRGETRLEFYELAKKYTVLSKILNWCLWAKVWSANFLYAHALKWTVSRWPHNLNAQVNQESLWNSQEQIEEQVKNTLCSWNVFKKSRAHLRTVQEHQSQHIFLEKL